MHKLNKMLIVALAAMSFASAKAQTTLPGSIQEAVKENVSAKAVMDNIMTRTSVRKSSSSQWRMSRRSLAPCRYGCTYSERYATMAFRGSEGQAGYREICRIQ